MISRLQMTDGQRRQLGESLLTEVRWREYSTDVRKFIRECVNIRVVDGSGVGGKRLLDLYPYQDEFIDLILSERYVLSLKARQLGFTTVTVAYALWLLMFKPGGATVLMMSKSQDDANKNLAMLDQMYRMLPEWVRLRGPKPEGQAKTEKAWRHSDGGVSRIRSLPPTTTTGAGETADLVILDEFDLYMNAEPSAVWNTIEPTTLAAASNPLSRGAVCVVVSTPRTPDGVFARMYKSGRARGGPGEGRFATLFVPATENRFLWTDGAFDERKYDAIAEEKRALGKPWLIYSEYPLSDTEAFRKSGRARFQELPELDECVPPIARGELGDSVQAGELLFQPSSGGRLQLFEMPRDDRFYVLSVDPSHGIGEDATVGTVLSFDDAGDPYVVAVWSSSTTEQHEAAPALFRLGRFFHGWQSEALLVFDAAGGHGELMMHVWRSMGYANFYTYIPKSARRGRASARFGITTSGTSGLRTMMLDKLSEVLPSLGNVYVSLLDELTTFVVFPDGRAAADRGCHDDHVMALAMGVWVLSERFRSSPAPVAATVGTSVSDDGTASLAGYLDDQAKLVKHRERVDRQRLARMARVASRRRK